MKRIIAFVAIIFLFGCGGSPEHTTTMADLNDYRRRVDVCIVEHGIGQGVRDYCESFARVQSTPVPTSATATPTRER